ncbi:MAG: hypothetical protein IPM29_24660 [Planctomycetes bacterium]|nr:hypothetical protein [Planctomycetota bacterium]
MGPPGLDRLARMLAERSAELAPWQLRVRAQGNGAVLEVRAPARERFRVPLEMRAGRLGHAAAAAWIGTARGDERGRMLAVPALGARVAEQLRTAHCSFVDETGNVFLWLDGGRLVLDVRVVRNRVRDPGTEGDAPGRVRDRTLPAGSRVLFALLARPENAARSVREIAAAAGVGVQTVASTLARLRESGHLVRAGRSGHVFAPGREHELIDRFVLAWQSTLRRSLVQVVLSTPHVAEDVESAIEALLDHERVPFGFGGSAGAQRVRRHYRSATTVVHVGARWQAAWNRTLRAATTSRGGSVVILHTMGACDLVPDRRYAHPVLLYAELQTSSDPREREFAALLLPDLTKELHSGARASR